MSGWVSPSMGPEQFEKLKAIEPGIPDYMRKQVIGWIVDIANLDYYGDPQVPKLLALAFKNEHLANNLPRQLASLSSDNLVSVLDWLLYFDVKSARISAHELELMLNLGRSEWTITRMEDNVPRMSRRIPTGVQQAYEDVVSKTGAAGSLLAQAFNAIYGASRNSDSAYGLSVKAVETLACPKFLPSNGRATLGSVIAHLSQKSVSLPLLEGHVPDKDLIISMMRKLWAGGERHGSESYEHVSLDGAKAALTLAVSLVSMLHEDVITVS